MSFVFDFDLYILLLLSEKSASQPGGAKYIEMQRRAGILDTR